MLVFILACLLVQPPVADASLPSDWHGVWSGTLKIVPEKGEPRETTMTLELVPIAETDRLQFRITYGAGEAAQVRDYELVPKKDKPGRFEIDEKNGIKLDARLYSGTLYSAFQVGDVLIQSKYERTGEVIRVEMVVLGMKDVKATKPNGGGAEVKSFPVVTVQTAELKRMPMKK
jgi:hypothetical protein